jgi:hypothetical protein
LGANAPNGGGRGSLAGVTRASSKLKAGLDSRF